jgi:HK97 family phage portal protein
MKSPFGTIANAVSRNSTASSEPPVVYARSGVAPNTLMQGGSDPGAYMRAYGASGTVFSIVSMLARQTAKIDWHLYRQAPQDGRRRYTTGDKGSDQRTEVLQHQAMNVWHKPNAFMSGFMLRELAQTYLDLTGESYLVVQRDGRASFPTGLWPVRPDRIEPVPHSTKFLAGYVYRGPSGEAVPLQPNEVIMVKYPNPYDIYHGLGPVQSILVDIDAARYSAQWNRNFFLNSAVPGGVIQVDKHLSDDEWNEFTDRWRESHRGMGAAHRVAVLEQGAVWVPNAHSLRDMDFANLRNVSRDVIREAFAMHKAMLGTVEDVNRANAQTAQEHFESFLINDRLARWQDTLNCFYLPMFGATGQGVELDYDDPVSSNREADALELKSKAQAAQVLVDSGYEPHDVLEVVGLPDMEVVETATQTPALPPAWVPAAPEAPAEPDTSAGAGADGQDSEQDTSSSSGAGSSAAGKPGARATMRPVAAADLAAIDLSEMDAQHQRATRHLTADYTHQILPVQRRQLVDQVRQLVAAGQIAQLAALAVSTVTAASLITAAMVDFGKTSANQASKEAHKQGATAAPVTPDQARLEEIAQATALLLATGLATSAGREAMRVAGGPDDSDPDEIATHVEDFLDSLSPAQLTAALAAALAAAQNQARAATFIAGPRCELIATEVNDRNTCSPCAQIDGTSFGFSDDPAAVDAAQAAYPTSGYTDCQGRDRCRGALAALYRIGADAAGPADWLPAWLTDLSPPPVKHTNGHALAGAR